MNNRSYVSVRTFLRGRFRPLEGPDDAPISPAGGFTSSAIRDDFLANATLPEVVTRFLAQMDMKLDALLAAHNEQNLSKDFPHGMDIHEISADRLTVSTPLPLAPGDHIEVYFQITHPFFTIVSGVGRVIRRKETTRGEFFDIEFTRLHEEEREKIIRFVFNEERKALRRQRLESDQNESTPREEEA